MLFFDPFTTPTTRTGRSHDHEVVRGADAVTVRFDLPGVAREAATARKIEIGDGAAAPALAEAA